MLCAWDGRLRLEGRGDLDPTIGSGCRRSASTTTDARQARSHAETYASASHAPNLGSALVWSNSSPASFVEQSRVLKPALLCCISLEKKAGASVQIFGAFGCSGPAF
ncbi:hypothetical protein L1887_55323 [Cichorium endivia]|nr:hypothetical protein L1887_55323 [Cichorium endivia]